MRLLLLNTNPAVSRLIKLSTDKVGYELDEFDDYGLVPLVQYDVILVDNEVYEEEALEGVKETSECNYVVYIGQRGTQKPQGVNVLLEKPFLPTDFLTLLEKAKNTLLSVRVEDPIVLPEQNDEEKAFDIDNIDTLDEDEPLTLPIPSDDEDTSLELGEVKLGEMSFEDETLLDAHTQDMPSKNEEELALDELDDASLLLQEDKSLGAVPAQEDDEELLEEGKDEATPCILDKDDINEVKQLLDDSDQEEENEALHEIDDTLAFLDDEDEDEKKEEEDDFAFEEDTKMQDQTDVLSLESLEDEDLALEEASDVHEMPTIAQVDEEEAEEEILPQEEIIDSFEETLVEATEEVSEDEDEADFPEDDALMIPHVDDAVEELEHEDALLDPVATIDVVASRTQDISIASLDDLNENLLKSAFGETIEEDAPESLTPDDSEDVQEEEKIDVIRGEIENSISRSISGLAQSDILREALKGMRINISITFDEK
ncbi:hypothetical protein [Sulfurospirillum sp. MES]|uniref:hypothetical protein n=1 Tax=Sulfurospirillum sp. MES TaxID=1565314 RepID=UPI0005422F8A|nr:hypothetical protein [Sulfurospirillum sp. MES]KHG34994.1 MAG: hypothetical protein OA34_02280 [Sulfurospirillum sp. MES]